VRTVLVGRPVAAVATALADGLIALGDAVVVVDIGNRATEVSIVADAGGAGRVLGREFTDDLGADVLDHAVQTHVCVESAVTLDTRSPHGRAASRALAAACRAARRELALSPATVIEVACPGRTEHVRMVRTEFESAIAEAIRAGVTAIAACARNGLAEGVDVRAVLLVGEAAATPLLTEMASALLRLPVVVPQYPEWAVAGGAAHITARAAAAAAAEFLANPSLPAQRPVPRRVAPAVAAPRHTAVPAPARPAVSGASPLPADLPRTSWEQPSSQPERSRIRTGMIAAIVAAALVIGGGITVAETGGGHGGGAGAFSHGGP
jgi:molecular chaperone DnaK (HSP70)